MAVRTLRLSVVFTIGLYLGPVALITVATNVTDIPGSISLKLDDPHDVYIARGPSANLKCRARSTTGKVHIRWLHNDSFIPENDKRRILQKDGTLHITKEGRKYNSTEGKYRCLASNEYGAVLSSPATLKIASLHDFIEQPKDTKVVQDQPVVLKCQIHSTPAATILWERSNLSLPQSTKYVPLPTGALLIITSTHSSDTGLYRCKATNNILTKNKTKYSNFAQLSVLPNDGVNKHPQILPLGDSPNRTVLVGENVTLYCIVNGWPIPSVQWTNSNNDVIGNLSILVLTNVTREMAGSYNCTAQNILGFVIKNYYVLVQQKPYFEVIPRSKSYPSAQTVRLECKASGIPEPEIYWLKNGIKPPAELRFRKQSNSLVISHSLRTDAGIYQCFAVNAVGSIWAAAQLEVAHPPVPVPLPPQNVSCRPYDDTSVCLHWSPPSNETLQQAYSIYSSYATGIRGPEYVTNETYWLASGLQQNTSYTFYIRAYTKTASDFTVEISCEAGKSGNRNLQVNLVGDGAVNLTWSEISSDLPCNKSAIIFYKVLWKKTTQVSQNVLYVKGVSQIIKRLIPSTTYEFRVLSETNKSDDSGWVSLYIPSQNNSGNPHTDNQNVYTENYDGVIPYDLEGEPVTSSSLNLTWVNMGSKYTYEVCYLKVGFDSSCKGENIWKSKYNYKEVRNLKPSTWYEFKVRTRDINDDVSPFSYPLQVQTPAKVPAPPVEKLHYNVVDSNTVCVKWKPPQNFNTSAIISYIVRYSPDYNWPLEKWHTLTVNGSSKSKACYTTDDSFVGVILDNVEPGLKYTVVVLVQTEIGLSNPPIPITFKTYVYEGNSTQSMYHKQKLGVILGLLLAFGCIICCFICLLFRRRCLKRRALAGAQQAASGNNYYYPGSLTATQGMTVQTQRDESCAAEAYEMQHLMSDEGATHIPPVTPAHLDTKGTTNYPNGQINGVAKPVHNGYIANGHVHITENPQYCVQDCADYIEESINHSNRNDAKPFEDPNSNLQNSAVLDSLGATKLIGLKPNLDGLTNQLHNQNGIRCKQKNGSILQSSFCTQDIHNDSLDSGSDNSLNATRSTYLDDSLVHCQRKVTPALGPNG